jgi:hypothetical protein
MAVLEGGVSAALAGIGAESQSALHTVNKPDPCGALGHYRTSHRTVLAASQAANSRLFELQNAHATNIIVIHAVHVEWMQTAAHTAAIMDSLDLYRCTGFSAVDTTNTVTPVASKLRASFGASGANLRGCTVAGIAAGMTGGTLTKDTAPIRQWGQWLLAAVPTAGTVIPIVGDYAPEVADGESPIILVQNEGIIIENRVALGVAAGSAVSIDIEWSEVTAY